MRRAVIDIGTNTVKLFVADVDDGNVVPVSSKDRTTRLGEGLNETNRLAPTAMARTIQTIHDFVDEARRLGAEDVRALTTSAAREAGNRDEFLQGVRDQCRLEVQVVTGEREAELIFRGVTTDPQWFNQPILVMDVGGGSTEFIQGENGEIVKAQSLPIGAVRLTEEHGENYVALVDFVRRTLHQSMNDYSVVDRRMIGTGGTITTLARIQSTRQLASAKIASAELMDHAIITADDLRGLIDRLRGLPLSERRKVRGLPPERADIIVAGGAVFLVAMEILGAANLVVSVRNLRYGAVVAS